MPNAAQRRLAKGVAGAIPVAVAMVAAAANAAPAQVDNTTHHKSKALAETHPSWATPDKDRGAVAASQHISTRVYLTGQNPAGLAAAARAVSDPNSPSFQHYLTPDQIKAQYGATPAQISAVQSWLTGAGMKITSVTGDWIDAQGDAGAVQRAFGTQIKNYQRPDGSVEYAAASAAIVPDTVADYVSSVSGLMQTSIRAHADSAKANTSPVTNQYCSTYWGEKTATGFPAGTNPTTPLLPCSYTPKQLRDAYGITKSGKTGKGATIAVVDWWSSSTMHADADAYATARGDKPFASGQYSEVVTPSQWSLLPTSNSAPCGSMEGINGEESLDVEMAHGLAPDANVVYVGANSCMDVDLLAAEQKIVDNHLADVVSNSWGEIMHTSDNQDIDPAVIPAYDRIFQKGALEGIGFTFSSGDCGDDDPANFTNGGANCVPDSARKQTEWPTSSQWVTSVGGTTLATDSTGNYAWEVAMGDHRAKANQGDPSWQPAPNAIPFFFGGGGGASEDIPQPWYQNGVVSSALATNLGTGHAAARPMRTVPDVAMNGSLATSVLVGQTVATGPSTTQYQEFGVGGTSVAAPEFAAIQADAKEAAGHAIGFANPDLYALAGTDAFHDVTAHPAGQPAVIEGVHQFETAPNVGRLYQVGEDSSLVAGAGYDDATGLGSPADNYLAKISSVTPPAPPVGGSVPVNRVAGPDRYATAIQVSQRSFPKPGSAPAVVLATGENFPDALAGVPLAAKLGAPLLLTPTKAADPRVTAEIHRVLAAGGHVYVLGGDMAVSDNAVAALGLPYERIYGNDRYLTSLEIAKRMGSPTHVVVATGTKFADALAAGPYASAVFGGDSGGPAAIVLSNDTVLSPAVAQYVYNATAVAAVGGQAVAATAGLPNVKATFVGADRYATAAKVSATFLTPQIAGVASGTDASGGADALTAAALLAETHSPLVLTDPAYLPGATSLALQGLSHALVGGGSVDVFGGPVAVSNAVEQQVASAVGGRVVS